MSIRSLAKTYKISRQSVRKYLDLTSPPIYQQRRKGVTLLDDFIDIIATQIEKKATSHSIFKQIQEKGYEGSFSTVHRYPTALRKQLKKEENEQKQSKTAKKIKNKPQNHYSSFLAFTRRTYSFK
ncbi:hypothetical protein P9274_24000 [Schinkia azotoformans]|uniref:hypothetical protein n=1 Tax=Schinkia azotoformans TaxID=1454 RepID=UPI002E21424D|nr:hypothetical protein [Schinkia azotoformans]